MIYFLAEFHKTHRTEWFPSFNWFLYENYLKSHTNISMVPDYKISGNFRACKIPELDYDIFVHGNINFLINIDTKKVICFNTYWNTRELINLNHKLFEDFNIIIYNGHFYEKEMDLIKELIQKNPNFKNSYTFKPWIFRPHKWTSLKYKYNPKNKKLFFRGLYIKGHRDFILNLGSLNNPDFNISLQDRIPHLDFMQNCSENLISLSGPGVRDMCYRDIELLSMGVPMIRTKFFSELLNTTLTDEVYIPVDFDPVTEGSLMGMPKDHEKLASDIVERWNQVKNDKPLLFKISQNAQDLYNEHFTNEKLMSYTYKIIETLLLK